MPFASALPIKDTERRRPSSNLDHARKLGMGAKRRKPYQVQGTPQSKARDQAIMGEHDEPASHSGRRD
jgi:hypothetical protein